MIPYIIVLHIIEFLLDPETAKKIGFDPEINIEEKALLHCRRCSWIDENKTESDECYHRIITGTIDADLYAIDGKTGKLCSDFGNNGRVDLTGQAHIIQLIT